MKIACPNCRTLYELGLAALGSGGRSVRCARCQTVWFVGAPKSGDAAAAARPHPVFTTVSARRSAAAAQSDIAETDSANSAEAPLAPDPLVEQATAVAEAPAAPDPVPSPPSAATDDAALDDGAFAATPAPPEIGQEIAAPDATIGPAPEPKAALEAKAAVEADVLSADVESIAKRRFSPHRAVRKPARPRWRVSQIAAIVAALAAVDGGLVIWRADVVRVLPQTATLFEHIGLPVNLRELAFKDLKTAYEEQDGATILVIDGTIVATGRKVVDVPRVRFAIQAANGHEIYAWTALPARTRLAPGESLPFKSRLASPPEQGRSVQVRFFNRQDVASGLL